LRASISSVVITFVLAGSLGEAAAQYYPPPAYPNSGPAYSSAPLPPPAASAPAASYGQGAPVYHDANGVPLCDPCSSEQAPVGGPYEPYPPASRVSSDPNDDFSPQPMPSLGEGPLRPPADVGDASSPDVTGSLRAPASAAPAPGANHAVIASLPPEDQPETGPPKELPLHFRRQVVNYTTIESPGTIIIDTPHTYLYLVLGNGTALRYGIGVGREGFTWSGSERISRMKEWPDWFPPKEMIDRQPYLPRFMAGGDTNPLGARALYLGNTLYRIHGTNQPSTIGTFVSSGCIRLTNEDISDLYTRVSVGTRVVVLPGASTPLSAAAPTTVTQ
jgi:lipoprotein-anchoring transpeptidase ErfK/SrfK